MIGGIDRRSGHRGHQVQDSSETSLANLVAPEHRHVDGGLQGLKLLGRFRVIAPPDRVGNRPGQILKRVNLGATAQQGKRQQGGQKSH